MTAVRPTGEAPSSRRFLVPLALGLLGSLALGCGMLEDAPSVIAPADPGSGASGEPAGRSSGGAAPSGFPAARSDAAPLYLFVYTHHYAGLGGYYPTGAEVRALAEGLVENGIAEESTLFMDGILVDKLMKDDPKVFDYIKSEGFRIGYHGEEAHGPYPVVVSVEQVAGKSKGVEQVGRYGYSFDEAVNAIQYRYCHGYEGCEFDSDGYLSRFAGGATDDSVAGGIRLVRQTLGRDIDILPGHAIFNPAARFAFSNETPYVMMQGAGVFSPHFLQSQRDQELLERTEAFCGEGSTMFWFMGLLHQKGTIETEMPQWSMEGVVTRSTGGGGGGRMGGEEARPPRGGDQGGTPPRGGGGSRPPRGAGYFGPHLLPFSVSALGDGMLGAIPAWLDQVQGGRLGGQEGGASRPPRGEGGSTGSRPPRGEGDSTGSRPPRGEGDSTGSRPPRGEEAGTDQARPPRGEEGAGSAAKGKAASSDEPGVEFKAAAAALKRQQPQVATFSLVGNKSNVSDAAAWVKAWTQADRKVEITSAATLREKVHDAEVKLDAQATARAVQEYWSKGPADFLVVDGTYATLAEGWEVMARHLAGEGDRIETSNVIGPTGRASELVQGKGTVTGAQVRAAAKAAWAQAEADKYRAMPTTTTVGSTKVGFHQLFWMMSEAILKGDSASITVPTAEYAPPYAGFLAGRLGRDNPDQTFWMEAQFWTIKPVTWK